MIGIWWEDLCLGCSVDMGYGHERARLDWKDLAEGVIVANRYTGMPIHEKNYGNAAAKRETISRLQSSLIGRGIFNLMDRLQLSPIYPRRDLSGGI